MIVTNSLSAFVAPPTRVGHAYAKYAKYADYAHMRNMRMRIRIENVIHIFHIKRGKIVFLKGNRSSSHFLSGAWTVNLVQISEQSLYQILFLDKVFHHNNPISKKIRWFFRNLFQNLCMSQSAVKFSGRQNVARKNIFFQTFITWEP